MNRKFYRNLSVEFVLLYRDRTIPTYYQINNVNIRIETRHQGTEDTTKQTGRQGHCFCNHLFMYSDSNISPRQ